MIIKISQSVYFISNNNWYSCLSPADMGWGYFWMCTVHASVICMYMSSCALHIWGGYLISECTSYEKFTVTAYILSSRILHYVRLLYVVATIITVAYSNCCFWCFYVLFYMDNDIWITTISLTNNNNNNNNMIKWQQYLAIYINWIGVQDFIYVLY